MQYGKGDGMKELLAACQQILPQYLKVWERLVNIDSGSGYSPGLRAAGEVVGAFCAEQGMAIEHFPCGESGEAFHLCARVEGNGEKSVLLLAHLDTVFPPGTARERPFRTDAEWAYGPGVSDCKGGVALALCAAALLKEREISGYRQVTCFFNCDEEISSPGSREIIMDLARRHDYVLSLEPGQSNDGVVAWRKGVGKLKVTVAGKPSHDGSDPEKGCNALLELMNQISRMSALAAPERQTTITFTQARSGERLNVVPDFAEAWADVRVVYPGEFDRVEKEARRTAEQTQVLGTKVTVSLKRDRPPFAPNEGTERLIALAEKIYLEIGRTLEKSGVGGASDANLAADAGAMVLDSLGPVKGGPNHTPEEKTLLNSIVPRLYLLIRMIQELGGGKD